MRRRWIKRGLLGTGALLLVLAGVLVAFAVPRWGAIDCLLAFAGTPPGEDGALLPGQRLVTGEEARLGYRRLLVQEAEHTPAPVLVLIHGVARKGLGDARIAQAVDAFARGGFTVVAPEVPLLVKPPEADRDEERLQVLLAAVARGDVPGGRGGRFGIVGVSVGGALAIRAAADFPGPGLRAVLAIGAPDDLHTLSETWFGLPVNKEVEAPWTFESQRRHDAAFARNVIFRAALGARVPDSDDRDALREWLETAETHPREDPPELSTEAARTFAALAASGPDRWEGAREALMDDAWPLMSPFSTAELEARFPRLAGITIFLLHGHGDSLVPASEYHRLRQRLARHTLVVGLESRMLGHVGVESVGVLGYWSAWAHSARPK